jgi:hypothetical protein
MAIDTPKKVVLNWYKYDTMFSIEFVESFVRDTEISASDTRKRQRTPGLDEHDWNVTEIFREYFPNLQRRSALLTLWAFLEHTLASLCVLYQSEKGFKVNFEDLGGKGLDRSVNYLEKIAGLDGLKDCPEWAELKAIQLIRNVIAHNDGRLKDHYGKPKTNVIRAMSKLGHLSGEDEIVVEEGFLSKVVADCNSYFKRIATSVEAKENRERSQKNVQPNRHSPLVS